MWGIFSTIVLIVLAFELGIFQRIFKKNKTPQNDSTNPAPKINSTNTENAGMPFTTALYKSLIPISLAIAFGIFLFFSQGSQGEEIAETFAAGYLMELALSVDNLFIFLLIFANLHIPPAYQQRVLFWGVFGAIAMRIAFIFCGVTLLEKFSWLMLVFGIILIGTAVKMLIPKKKELTIEKNIFVRIAQKFFPITTEFHQHHFFIRNLNTGKILGTPLFLALIVVEGSDVVFAVDSIPAVMGIIPPQMPYDLKLFVALTSNIFAILGLRSLFFVLHGFLKSFWLLEYGLAAILGFIGIKMILTWCLPHFHISPIISLAILAIALTSTIILSISIPHPTKKSPH